ncbi:diphthine synthase [Thecamonas trahens ATCC 50062]|uniref:diphthine methyl ester synthase n=1 Tax=Thecamonas trahens ATCC 50062 TaxID=461836 RepID=A0A0L0DB39_THETB|nr:diphthine synthase [Thecamonas trahens ATCC 50062]KNC49547.1 diphthine synthase [Thecamonas trahens ATCC 50062]|eukprot:XP_013757658.1 diphthine synthase [Thecamonas trahens ATCC 50062]
MIGLGLGDAKDITVKGLEAVRTCARVYLEAYTSVLGASKEELEAFYGVEVIVADRELVESGADDTLIEPAKEENIGFLVVGDPFGATTHTDLVVRARAAGVTVSVIHNASIMNAAGACGLQLYNFGLTVSVVFFTETWRPDSFYNKVKINAAAGLHTLCLLDIKMKEISDENLAKGRMIYDPPRFMTVNQCLSQFLEVEEKYGEGILTADTQVVALARVGQETQVIAAGSIAELLPLDFGPPLHSLVVVGETHFLEDEILAGLSQTAELKPLADGANDDVEAGSTADAIAVAADGAE